MKIALLDDKEYGRQQVVSALRSVSEAEVFWFPTVEAFCGSGQEFDIVLLDYYLDLDGITGDSVVEQVRQQARVIIGFSSIDSGNRRLLEAGADHAVRKLPGDRNDPLAELFIEIL